MSESAQERDRQRRLRGRNNDAEFRRRDCAHIGEKKIDGNKVICLKCGRLAGFVQDPRTIR